MPGPDPAPVPAAPQNAGGGDDVASTRPSNGEGAMKAPAAAPAVPDDTPSGRVVAEVGTLLAKAVGVANNALGQVQGQLEAYDQQYFDGKVGTTVNEAATQVAAQVNEATATLGEATAAHRERAGEFLGAALERARAANAEVLKHAENLRSGVLPELPVRTLTASLARAAQATEFVKERAAQYDARFNASARLAAAKAQAAELAQAAQDPKARAEAVAAGKAKALEAGSLVADVVRAQTDRARAAIGDAATYVAAAARETAAQVQGLADGLRDHLVKAGASGLARARSLRASFDERFPGLLDGAQARVKDAADDAVALAQQGVAKARALDEAHGISTQAVAHAKSLDARLTGGAVESSWAPWLASAYEAGLGLAKGAVGTCTGYLQNKLAEMELAGPLAVVPDVVDRLAPTGARNFAVAWDGGAGAGGCEAQLGNVLTPTQVAGAPSVTWDAADVLQANGGGEAAGHGGGGGDGEVSAEAAFYTLVMTDPDAPSRADPKLREWQHWVVGNIPGATRDAADGDVLSAYVGAGPPEGSGLHRYVFLLYKQPGAEPLSFDGEPRVPDTSAEHRSGWRARDFAARYGLGDPVAARVFQAEFDAYVPVLMKQLGF